MIGEGDQAPRFELPAVVDGEVEPVDLQTFLGGNVVVLAFYPGDFNPACDGDTTGLDDLDIFDMQPDVTVLAVSAGSVYSHRAFARQYGIGFPLLADVRGEVTAAYGMTADPGADGDGDGISADATPPHLTRRALVVVGPDGDVQGVWVADSVDDLPDVTALRGSVEAIDDAGTAAARYRAGHARYVEGRRAFTGGMSAFDDREWLIARDDFQRAEEAFSTASDRLRTAARFAEADPTVAHLERAVEKAGAFEQAAEWLRKAAGAFASGNAVEGDGLLDVAETQLETAGSIAEPVSPDQFPPDDPGATGAADSPFDTAEPTDDGTAEEDLAAISAEIAAQSDEGSNADPGERNRPEVDTDDRTSGPEPEEGEPELEEDTDAETEELELDLTDPTDRSEEDREDGAGGSA